MKIYWTRLWYIVKDGDLGYVLPWAVVTYAKSVVDFIYEDMGDGKGRSVPSTFQHSLLINLWLIRFDLLWETHKKIKFTVSQTSLYPHADDQEKRS